MNVVIFGKGLGKPRQISLSGITACVFGVVVAGLVSGAGFAGGYWYSSMTGSGISTSELVGLTDELGNARENIATIRQENEDTLPK